MKELNIKLKLYSYDELNEEAKNKAYTEHEEFIYTCPPDYENDNGELVPEDLTKWTDTEIKEYVEDSIRINEYLFFNTGELADSITYTGKHNKAGKVEIKLYGEVYEV